MVVVAVLLLPFVGALLLIMDRIEDRVSAPAPARGLPGTAGICGWSPAVAAPPYRGPRGMGGIRQHPRRDGTRRADPSQTRRQATGPCGT